LVKQDVRYHDDAPFLDGERRLFYWIDSRWNYPLIRGTPPRFDPIAILKEDVADVLGNLAIMIKAGRDKDNPTCAGSSVAM
jgi:hypothetical protein